jgi:membrane-associated protease RseP (regulator of RpoE activity)
VVEISIVLSKLIIGVFMPKWLQTLLAILFLGFAIFIHECGHFVAMNQSGVEVETFSIGFPLVPTYKMKVAAFPKTTIEISPILFGGYVKPTDAGRKLMKELPLTKRAHIDAAGVEANLFAAMLMMAVSYLTPRDSLEKPRNVAFVIVSLFCAAAWFLTSFFELFVLPIFGVFLIGSICYTRAKSMMGPAKLLVSFRDSLKGIKGFPLAFAVINVDLFVFNVIPLAPIDGGHIVGAIFSLISERSEYLFLKITFLITFTTLWLVLGRFFWKSIKRYA